MNSERRDFELWRTGDWRCEWWSVGGRPQVRLYLGEHQVADLMPGPHLDLWRQTAEWRAAALADQQQHQRPAGCRRAAGLPRLKSAT